MTENTISFNPFSAPATVEQGAVSPPADPSPVDPPAASLSMTKVELLERVQQLEAELTKARILDRIHRLEDEKAGIPPAEPVVLPPPSTETRAVTIDGVPYAWTEATEDTVPEEARLVYARSKAAGG